MPTNYRPASRSELRHRAMVLGHELRASLPWWNVAERVRIGFVLDRFTPTVSN